jgi:DNA polymerase-3 subunit gamma/tau
VKFVFATTEPEKVIGTIRSRTHHYPFRLIPPRTLSAYLAELCEREGVRIEPAALPLVVRAGGGSARDTLSVLDQLIGGAGPDGVTHELATGLLGYTPDTLLDEVLDAFAAGDGGTVFGVVDKVIETGQDPRRFTEDLLRRLRDLVILGAVPDASATGLIDVAEDQGERLVAQAARFGRADLSRAADLVAAGLTEMRGATAPRLLLELICARVLLPGSDDSTHGVLARLDRIEKRIAIEGGAPAEAQHVGRPAPRRASSPSAAPSPTPTVAPPSSPSHAPGESPSQAPGESPSQPPAPPAGPDQSEWPTPAQPGGPSEPHQPAPRQPAQPHRPADATPAAAAPPTEERQEAAATTPGDAPGSSSLSLVEVRRLWPDLLESVKLKRRFTWIMLSQNAQVAAVDDKTLTVALLNAGARDSFLRSGSDEILRQAAIDVIGRDWRVDAIVDPSAQPGADHDPAPTVTRPAVRRADDTPPAPADQGGGRGPSGQGSQSGPAGSGGPGAQDAGGDPRAGSSAAPEASSASTTPTRPTGSAGRAAESSASPETASGQAPESRVPVDPQSIASVRGAIQRTRAAGAPAARGDRAVNDDDVDLDDPNADDHQLGGAELLARELGAQVIEEIKHD